MRMFGILQYMHIMRILNATKVWITAVGKHIYNIIMIEQLKKARVVVLF